jgi:hypothetical protein
VIAGGTSGLRIADNYFETNNSPSFGGPMVLKPASGSESNITVQADIVLNGASDLYSSPWPHANTCESLSGARPQPCILDLDLIYVLDLVHVCTSLCLSLSLSLSLCVCVCDFSVRA